MARQALAEDEALGAERRAPFSERDGRGAVLVR